MSLSGLLDIIAETPAGRSAFESARAGDQPTLDLVAPEPLRPFLVAGMAAPPPTGADRPMLAVTATIREAEKLVGALSSLLPEHQVAEFPAWETLPHERLSPRSDTVGRRLAVLRRLAHPSATDPATGPLRVVVAPIRSVLQPIVSGLADLEPVSLREGDEVEFDDVIQRLADAAYTRVDLVEKRGEFAVRGGILDVFPPTEEHPLRVEFFGDQVDEIRAFKVADQRSLDPSEVASGQGSPAALWAPPCRELLLTPEVRERAKRLAAEHPSLAEMLEKLADGIPVEGMEAFSPVLADGMDLLLDYLPSGAHVMLCDPERVRTRALDLTHTSQEFLQASWAAAASGGEAPIDLGAAAYKSIAEVRGHALEAGIPWWSVTPFSTSGAPADDSSGTGESVESDPVVEDDSLVLPAQRAASYRGETHRAVEDVRAWLSDTWRVVLVTEGHGSAERLTEMLREEEIGARLDADLAAAPEPAVAHVTTGLIEHGFVLDEAKTAVLTEADVVGQQSSTKDMRRLPSRRRGAVDPLQLQPGDPVVHEHHGVGRYVEMIQRTLQGATREYLVLEYARGDRLFVPTDQLDLVTRYVGGEAPSLNRLGGSDWQKTKGRAKKAVREIAGELIRLYSARQAAPGHAFGADTPWQRELEDAFPHPETPDQQAAIDEVKADMERPVPMDRLICGDVGYGKTEIAVRAAFKAIQDGKQVAVLVPTTLLVQQHYSTFSERFASFPVNVASASRFNTDAEQREVMRGVAEGTVDIVIGTHRLLQSETRFKNLGLLVVDEEQRFGVEHKEYLKQLRAHVDVLSMSATPIPRTLEMGVSGIREMSTILTPPEERHPVLTFVGPYEEKQIAAALRREMLRDGQVFYIHNRVASIEKVARRLRELVPEARIGVAHGRMNEDALEHVMVDFWEKAYDVLVCTTIVESGLDIPNANTLILDRADTFGLSQLHQLRGRVGRSRERAYAYFLYPPEKPLTETAHDRLATIAQAGELGAGMQVAMKDLELRGAGNLLGGEQSGHIEGVGFDLYVRMVSEAVQEYKGERPEEPVEVKVELPVDAHIPHHYVPGERLRLEAYRRIAAVDTLDDVTAVRDELTDRYGAPPAPVHNLLEVARFRARARAAGLTEVALQGNYARFAPVDLPESAQMRLRRLYPKAILKTQTHTLLVPVPKTGSTGSIGGRQLRDLELLQWCQDLVDAVFPDSVHTGEAADTPNMANTAHTVTTARDSGAVKIPDR